MNTLSNPVTTHNLTAWFILAPTRSPAVPDHDYSVLEESIEAQTALVHETGQVRELLIENIGDTDLFIQAGDIVKGGRQDRTIGSDFIVPAKSGRIPLPAFCVEKARWHRRNSEAEGHFSGSKDFVSSKKARLAIHLAKDQGAVWKSVASEQQALHHALAFDVCSAESPTSLQLTYENGGVKRAIKDYTTILEHAPGAAGGPVVGVVWAINGVPSHADCYASEKLFAKLWRKLLQAAATEAIGQRHLAPLGPCDGPPSPTACEPAIEEIHAWLAGRADDQVAEVDEEQLPPRTRLRTHRGRSQHRFEAFDTGHAPAVPVHVAFLAE